MSSSLNELRKVLRSHADQSKAVILMKFFKTGKGEYAQGDRFLGITVPVQRTIAARFAHLPLKDVGTLIKSPLHEERLVSLLILMAHFKRGDDQARKIIFDFYLKNTRYINNWDLVDVSAHHIVGFYLEGKDKMVLKRLAVSSLLWERRIAMVATFHEIRKGRYETAIMIARILLNDQHDLMHKAVGWMLREVGKRASRQALEDFLKEHHKVMPRTALRYAIEHFPPQQRAVYLKGIE